MKKKKALIALLISIGIFAVIIIGAAGIWTDFSDYSTVLKANWNFSLPSDAHYSEIYHQNDEASFHGDGIRYHVFYYKEAEPVSKMFMWQSTEQSTIYSGSYSKAADEWLNKIAVSSEERPNYTECSYWYQSQDDNSEIIIFWDKNKSMVYIVESFL